MSLKQAELKRKYSLKDFTTIKIGGEAKYFFCAESIESLQKVIKNYHGICYVLGGGSNLLVADGVLEKCVVKLGSEFSYIREKNGCLEIGGATPLSHVIRYALANNLGGFDSLVGIPATLGGLVVMNASSFGIAISAYLREVEAMDREGNVIRIKKEEISFAYRTSSLEGCTVLRIWFDAVKDYSVKEKTGNFIKKRLDKQDFGFPSCGCVFKNPETNPAGFLIDSCGLKGFRKNDAQISCKHANFMINLNKASYNDADYVINHVKETVHKKFGIILTEEIRRWA